MKQLKDFISESIKESAKSTILFDFTGLEEAEDILNSLKDRTSCSIEDNILTVTVVPENVSDLESVQDILQQYSDMLRNSHMRTNNEQYAQKTKKFESNVNKLNDAIESILNPDEEE